MEERTRVAVDQNAFNARITGDPNRLSADSFERVFETLSHSFALQPQISYIGIGLERTGEYCMLERLPDGTPQIREYRREETGEIVIRDYAVTPQGRKLLKTLPWDNYRSEERRV